MKLHTDRKLFSETLRAASQRFGILEVFMEKDYWITFVLNQLSQSRHAEQVVFKGGTSLSKGYGLIHRFSEDVDIALLGVETLSGNVVKNILRTVEKDMTAELDERIIEGVSSKGSRFRKSVFEYKSLDPVNTSNTLIVEINSFANPFPFRPLTIKSFAYDFLIETDNEALIEKYNLQPFQVNVLDKEQTLLEKLVSLIRFSFDADPKTSIASKIRHFYDLYYLMNDPDCIKFVKSAGFQVRFKEILLHDRDMFEIPDGWGSKSIHESPLFADFDNLWAQLKDIYMRELSALAFEPIPDEGQVADQFKKLGERILED